MEEPIRIVLVDDHSLFRESLSRLLETEPNFSIVATCANITELLSVPRLDEVDVLLLDYDLGDEEGTRFLALASNYGFKGRTLLVTAGMEDAVMLRAIDQGASGVFLKHSPPSHLAEAIRKVAHGDMWLDPGVTRSILAAASGAATANRRRETLSEREQATLRGVLEGLTNKEIGAQLGISESSVKAVLQQLFDKTGVRTRSQLVRIAIEEHSEDWLSPR